MRNMPSLQNRHSKIIVIIIVIIVRASMYQKEDASLLEKGDLHWRRRRRFFLSEGSCYMSTTFNMILQQIT